MEVLASIVAQLSVPEERRHQELLDSSSSKPCNVERDIDHSAPPVAASFRKLLAVVLTTNPPKELQKHSLNLGIPHLPEPLTLVSVQRLFSMFPEDGPGLALLLLRISVATFFLISAIKAAHHFGVSSIPLLCAAVLLISTSLSVGFLTPFLSIVAFVCAVANLLIGFNSGNIIYLFTTFDAAALGLLGPGAYSVDARLFGRRVTILPSRGQTNRP
jgi:hypothetical protein